MVSDQNLLDMKTVTKLALNHLKLISKINLLMPHQHLEKQINLSIDSRTNKTEGKKRIRLNKCKSLKRSYVYTL